MQAAWYDVLATQLDELDRVRRSRRDIRLALEQFSEEQQQTGVRKYVHTHLEDKRRHTFLYTLVAATGTVLEPADLLKLAQHLSEQRSEDSDAWGAVRKGTGENQQVIRLLLSELVLGRKSKSCQAELLDVFPEVKRQDPLFFLQCWKHASLQRKDSAIDLAAGIIDLPPDEDETIRAFVRYGLALFNDATWSKKAGTEGITCTLGGLFTLASVLLDRRLLADSLLQCVRVIQVRDLDDPVDLLATPFLLWMGETETLLPGLEDMYRSTFRNATPNATLPRIWNDLEQSIFINQEHRELDLNPKVLQRQKWRQFRQQRAVRANGSASEEA